MDHSVIGGRTSAATTPRISTTTTTNHNNATISSLLQPVIIRRSANPYSSNTPTGKSITFGANKSTTATTTNISPSHLQHHHHHHTSSHHHHHQQQQQQYRKTIEDNDVERELTELIDAETHVDMDRLKDLSRHGIPDALRGQVWRYLLGVTSSDKTQEVTRLKQLKMSYVNRCNSTVMMMVMMSDDATSLPHYKQLFMKIKSCLNHEKHFLMKRLRVSLNSSKSNSNSSSGGSSGNGSNGSNGSGAGGQSSGKMIDNSSSINNNNNNMGKHVSDMMESNISGGSVNINIRENSASGGGGGTLMGDDFGQNYEDDEERKKSILIQMEHVLLVFLLQNTTSHTSNHGSEQTEQKIQCLQSLQQNFDIGLIDLLCPFVYALNGVEHDIYYCFEAFMNKILPRFPIGLELNQSVGKLMTLFRSTQIDLYRYFEQEEVEPNDWANPWIRYMLSRELPMNFVCRLYDQYFATDDFDLHYYVCLAILQHFQEELMELDYSEIRLFLRFLPAENMDLEKIIKHAYNIRAYVSTRYLF